MAKKQITSKSSEPCIPTKVEITSNKDFLTFFPIIFSILSPVVTGTVDFVTMIL